MIGTATNTVLDIMPRTMLLMAVVCGARKTLIACKLIAKEAMKKENRIFQYFLRASFLYEIIVNEKNETERPTLYVKSKLGGIIENGKTNRPEREGRLTPHIRNKRNRPRFEGSLKFLIFFSLRKLFADNDRTRII